MTRIRKLVIVGAVVLVVGALSAGVAIATTDGSSTGSGDEQPLGGSALEQASAAALAHTGGGTVVETEAGDDGATYGVEIRLADGSQVEVSLDASFKVIGQESDDDGSGGGEETDGD